MEMTDEEKAAMLSDVSHAWCDRMVEVVDDYQKLITTYPELKAAMSVVVQVSIAKHTIIQAMVGRKGDIEQTLISLNQMYLGRCKA